jgi:hypothetical protein
LDQVFMKHEIIFLYNLRIIIFQIYRLETYKHQILIK